MENIEPYLEILKEELLLKCSSIDNSISTFSIPTEVDVKKMRLVINALLEKRNTTHLDKKTTLPTISVSTLKRLYKYGYTGKLTDQRVSQTLDKLVQVISYSDWTSFCNTKRETFSSDNIAIEQTLKNLIANANAAEFNAYKKLPEVVTDELQKYHTADSSAYSRVVHLLVQHRKRKWVINNNLNPSTYEEYDFRIVKLTSVSALIETNEYWYLRWFDLNTSKYAKIYDKTNTQTWKVINTKDGWKVKSVYYPTNGNINLPERTT